MQNSDSQEKKGLKRGTGFRALKNLSSLAVSRIIFHSVSFIILAYLARKLTANGFGRLAFAQVVMSYFLLIGNFGLNFFGIREVATKRDKVLVVVGNVITLQTLLSILAACLLVLFALVIPKPAEDKILISLFGIYIIITGMYLDWACKGLERMEIVAAAEISKNIAYLCLILLFVKDEGDILKVPVYTAITTALMVAIPIIFIIKRYGWFKPSADLSYWKYALKTAVPFFFSIVLMQIYFNMDTVMLSFMKTDTIVGLYNAAHRVMFVLIAFSNILFETMFPLAARFYKESHERLEILMNFLTKVYVTLAVPIGVGGVILAEPLIDLIYGESYSAAAPVFRILIWSVTAILISTAYGMTLIACNEEKKYMIGVACGAFANIALNFALIPAYGMEGAAVATLAAQAAVTVYVIIYASKLVRIRLVRYVWRPIIATGVMGLVLVFAPFHVVANMFIGIVVYLAAFLLLGGVGEEDVNLIKRYL